MFDFIAHILLFGIIFSHNIPIDVVKDAHASANVSAGPARINEKSLGIEVSAPYVLVIEKESGNILFEKNKKLQSPIASITKLMTALVFLDHNPGWGQELTIQASDIKNGGQALVSPGEKFRLKDIFHIALISSSNEATMALARSTGFTEEDFIKKMNEKAKSFGLEHTFFIDPTGLEPANISNAYETAIFAKHAFSKKDISEALQKKEYVATTLNTKRKITAVSTDKLLDSFINDKSLNYSIVGAKTGYINESQYCFTAEVSKDGNNIILVLLGSKSANDRWNEAKGLIDWTFSNFRW